MFKKNTSYVALCRNSEDVGLLFLRIAVGIPFIVHGITKLMDVPGTAAFFATVGLPLFFVYFIGFFELIGGLMILLGIYAWIGGWMITLVMAGAYIIVKHKFAFIGGMSFEIDYAFFFAGLAIAFLGSGKYSVVRKTCRCNTCMPWQDQTKGDTGVMNSCNCEGKGGCNEMNCKECAVC